MKEKILRLNFIKTYSNFSKKFKEIFGKIQRILLDQIYIASSALILSSIGGCVLNKLLLNFFPNGFEMYNGTDASSADFIGSALDIFLSASASPCGYLVRSAPLASAIYSLFLEIASLTICANIGARIPTIIAIIIIAPPPLPLPPHLPPPYQNMRDANPARIPIAPIIAITSIVNLIS